MSTVQNQIEYENDRVTVVRFRFSPHATVPMHQAPDLVAIWLTDSRLKLTYPDGTSRIEDHQAGEITWQSAQQHAGENLKDDLLEFVAVQFKSNRSKD